MNLDALKKWFLQNRRDFPWRENPTPYEVWISEVMLQQTQSARVVDYFLRWLRRFPTVEELAKADLDEVLKLWEGLGYYSRARAIHLAAGDIVRRFKGKIPDSAEDLSTIKGLGPYTVGAILSFGYQKKHPAVDANVMRVLCRYFALDEDICKAKTQENLRKRTLELLPDKDPHIISEALIELGAAVCKKNPECACCPLKGGCKSLQEGTEKLYPIKSQKTSYTALYRDVAVVRYKDFFLLRQGREGIACSGLYEFPYFETSPGGGREERVQEALFRELGVKTAFVGHLDEEKQSFTRYRVTLYPKLYTVKEKIAVAGHEWHTHKQAEALTFSSGHKRILAANRFLIAK